MIDYKFDEGRIIDEIKRYIDGTYDEHYATGKIQATESIIDDGHGTGFCMGNVGKYGRRYGKKGETPTEWRKDLMKVIHYSIIQLYIHDKEYSREKAYEDLADFIPNLAEPFLNNHPNQDRRLNDATPEEWDKAGRPLYRNPNGLSAKGER